jgi:hypothetical protein
VCDKGNVGILYKCGGANIYQQLGG